MAENLYFRHSEKISGLYFIIISCKFFKYPRFQTEYQKQTIYPKGDSRIVQGKDNSTVVIHYDLQSFVVSPFTHTWRFDFETSPHINTTIFTRLDHIWKRKKFWKRKKKCQFFKRKKKWGLWPSLAIAKFVM